MTSRERLGWTVGLVLLAVALVLVTYADNVLLSFATAAAAVLAIFAVCRRVLQVKRDKQEYEW
ncbi:hypothetical protein [Gordonia sp. (in: high G+C Gram-positive bacteria)]|uniref:hypothetical protein n=1 Tax=Gordonia sp. (in: high G+C Gram-positive bacteria) TaxID=84139 RepID=UPI003F9C6A20